MIATEQMLTLATMPKGFAASLPNGPSLHPISLKTMQINVGRVCNQACLHCHVDASPARTESMSLEIAKACLDALARTPEIELLDITGGAPEMNPHFRYLVTGARELGRQVMDRCNLTILEAPGYEDLHLFLAKQKVEITASLPHFSASTTDRQRGGGVFEKSIQALRKLNSIGYGYDLPLFLVYNPGGFFLASNEAQMEAEFRTKLRSEFGIEFTRLFSLNNMPISRFLVSLIRRGKFQEYMDQLVNAFNPGTLEGLMCRHLISVGYEGFIFDCDFNQMLELPVEGGMHISEFNLEKSLRRKITLANHCFGCTAGAGSSCGGSLDKT